MKVLDTHGEASAQFALPSFSAWKLSCRHHKSALNNIRFYSVFFPFSKFMGFCWVTNEKESTMEAGSNSALVVPAQGTEDIASELNGNGCW